MIFTLLGLLLLATAGLKLYGWGTAAVVDTGWWTDPRVRLVTIEWEIFLGAWLIVGVRPVGSWVAAVLTFTAFAGLSGYLGLRGVPSCGCFGAAQANPWWAFAVDVAALSALFWWRPDRAGFGYRLRAEFGGAWPLTAAAGVVAVIGLTAFTRLSEASDGLVARVRGDALTAVPSVVDVGAGLPGEVREGAVELFNWSDRPLAVYGGTTGCNYDILSDCPTTIPAGSSAKFRVRYKLPEKAGRSAQPVAFWTAYESGGARTIRLALSGETTAAVSR